MLLGFTGSIWLLIIAFREKLEQGLLCLLVPCYQLYYVCSRWQETRGPFILQMLPGLNVIVAVVAGLSIAYARGYDPLAGALSTDAGSVPAPPMPPARIVVKGQRFKVERAERIFREYGTSIDNLTNQLIDAQRPGTKVGSVRDLAQSFNIAEMLQKQVSQVNLNWVEWAAVKHRVGEQLRASLTALKGEMLKIESQPDKKGAFGEAPRMIDKEIIFWTLKSDEQVAPELEDGPAMPVGPVTVPAEQPQPGSGGQPGVGAPPGVGRRQGLGPPSGFGRRPGLNPPPGFGTPRARSGGGPFGRGSRNPANSGGNSPTYTPPG
jgi:hypothetical protein